MDDATAITGGFVGLLIGLGIVLAGVFMGGVLEIIVVGGVLSVISVAGFVTAAFRTEQADGAADRH